MGICPPRIKEQPNWLYDLIAAVERYEDVHEHVKEGGGQALREVRPGGIMTRRYARRRLRPAVAWMLLAGAVSWALILAWIGVL